MTLCSNNGGLLKAGVSMDPYSSSFIRPDPSSVATERVMHCGPVQDTPTAASSAESTERGWIGGDLTGRKEGLKNEEVAAVPYPLSSLQKLVDSVPTSGISLQGSPLYEGRLSQASSGTAMAPSLVEGLRSGHANFVKHHHISIVELPESSLRIKKSQSCDDSSSTKTEIEELEQFSEGEENTLDNGLDLPNDFTFGSGSLTRGFATPFSSDDPAIVPQQSRTKTLTGHLSTDSSIAETRNMDTSSAVVTKDGTVQIGLRSKRKKKQVDHIGCDQTVLLRPAETVVEKAASIVGNRGNDDVDDLVAFINSTSEEDKTSALKKNRKSKVKQSKPSPPQRSEPDLENHKETSLDKPKIKSPEINSSQKSKSKIVSLPSKDIIDVDKTNNNDILESRESQPNSNTCTSNSSDEDKTPRSQIVNRSMTNKEQEVLYDVHNYSVEPKREDNKPKMSNSGTEGDNPSVEDVLQDDMSKGSEILTHQAPPVNDRKAEMVSTKGNPKLTKQSKPPIGTLISSRLPASSNNSNKHRSFKQQQQQTLSSKKAKPESEMSSNPDNYGMDSEKRHGQNKHYETREKKIAANPPATQIPISGNNGFFSHGGSSEDKSQDQDVPCALKSGGEGRTNTASSQTLHLESHHPVTRSNAKKMGETAAHDHGRQPHFTATLKETEVPNLAGTDHQTLKDSGFQNCFSPRPDLNQKFHPDPTSGTVNNYPSSETKQQQIYNDYSVGAVSDSRNLMESSTSQEANGYPKPLITPDRHQLQDYRFRQVHPQHISHKPVIRSIEVHNSFAPKFPPDMHQRHRKEHPIHPFRPHAPHHVPPTEVQIQLQQQALQDVHFRSLQLNASHKQTQQQMPNVLRNGNQILPSDPCETLPQLSHPEGTQQMGPASTSTKDVCDVHHFQHNSKILDQKGNQFNIKEVVNFLRQEWDLVSNENLSNRPVYFNSN